MIDIEKIILINEVAMKVFAMTFVNAQNMGELSSEQRHLLFKMVAEIAYEAATAFAEVKEVMNKKPVLS